MHVTNGMPLEHPLHLTVTTGNRVTTLKALIDSTVNCTGAPILSPGVYHISKPLKLAAKGTGHQSFLVGAGPDKTFIFALDPAMSMVVGAGDGGSTQFNLGAVVLDSR